MRDDVSQIKLGKRLKDKKFKSGWCLVPYGDGFMRPFLWGVFLWVERWKNVVKCEKNNEKEWVYNVHNVARLPHI